jgi:hypothetical protein
VVIDSPLTTARDFPVQYWRTLESKSPTGDTLACEDFASCPPAPAPTPPTYDLSMLDAVRNRGARLYCAAKSANKIQNDPIQISSRKAFSIGSWDFLSYAPTITVQSPIKSTTTPGAYSIPLQLGVKPYLIDPLLPLPDQRFPLSFVVGDSETTSVSSANEYDPDGNDIYHYYQSRYITGTHGTTALSTSREWDLELEYVLYDGGFYQISLVGALSVQTGSPADIDPDWKALIWPSHPEQQDPPTGVFAGSYYYQGPYPYGTVNGPPNGWSGGRNDFFSADAAPGDYVAAPWTIEAIDGTPPSLSMNVDAGFWNVAAPKDGTTPFNLAGTSPMAVRAFGSVDNSVLTKTDMTLKAGLQGQLGADVNVFGDSVKLKFAIQATGTMNVAQSIVFRTGLDTIVQRDSIQVVMPVDAMVVSAASGSSLSVSAAADLVFELDVAFIHWSKTIHLIHWDVPVTAATPRPWDSKESMVLEYGSDRGDDTRLGPTLTSQLPAGRTYSSPVRFDSFGDYRATPGMTPVEACLSDSYIAPPPSMPASNGQALTTPKGAMCAEFVLPPSTVTFLPCNYQNEFVAGVSTAAGMKQCVANALAWYCTPSSTVGPGAPGTDVAYQTVVSHVMSLPGTPDYKALENVLVECGTAAAEGISNPSAKTQAASNLLTQWFTFGPCRPNGDPMSPPALIPGTEPTCSTWENCQDATTGGCGWCESTATPMPGDRLGPRPGAGTCPPLPNPMRPRWPSSGWRWYPSQCGSPPDPTQHSAPGK